MIANIKELKRLGATGTVVVSILCGLVGLLFGSVIGITLLTAILAIIILLFIL